MAILYPREALSRKQHVLERIDELRGLNEPQRSDRQKIRAIMDGGKEGVQALTGKRGDNDSLPAANLILSASKALGQKLGFRPDIKVDPPVSNDSDAAKKKAERRARIVETLDERSRLALQLPQLGRWLPGYGFTAWTIKMKKGADGQPYPHLSVRDPYETYPGQWGIDQQPKDVCFVHRVERRRLAKMYPDYRDEIMKGYKAGSGGLLLGSAHPSTGGGSWSNQANEGLDVYEYWNEDGTYWIVPEINKLLEFVPNPIDNGPLFYIMKRFSFNKLIGQYDHVIGLQANIARLNLLSIIATQDAVFAETNVIGDMLTGKYERGQNATNFLMSGSQVQKMNDRVPFEVFQQIDRLEQQLRKTAGYPVTDDAISPNSFVTGQGLQELKSSVDLEVREYQTIERHGLEDLDSKRLEFLEKVHPNREFRMAGVRKGAPYSESFTPSTHIKGDYQTRRVFGVMAGWDEPTKIVGGLNLLQAEVIDVDTLRENIDGLDDHTKIAERVRNNKIEDGLFQTLFAMGQQGDPRALKALTELLPEGDDKRVLTEFFIEPLEEEQGQGQGQGQGQAPPEGPPPDVQTVLSRLTNTGEAQGVQTVGRT